jgi:hypothetical protein
MKARRWAGSRLIRLVCDVVEREWCVLLERVRCVVLCVEVLRSDVLCFDALWVVERFDVECEQLLRVLWLLLWLRAPAAPGRPANNAASDNARARHATASLRRRRQELRRRVGRVWRADQLRRVPELREQRLPVLDAAAGLRRQELRHRLRQLRRNFHLRSDVVLLREPRDVRQQHLYVPTQLRELWRPAARVPGVLPKAAGWLRLSLKR